MGCSWNSFEYVALIDCDGRCSLIVEGLYACIRKDQQVRRCIAKATVHGSDRSVLVVLELAL